jgi:DNA primase
MIAVQELKNRITPEVYFTKELPNFKLIRSSKWLTVNCSFHADSKPSMRINLESGGFFCHSCGAKGGDIISFEMQRSGLSFKQAIDKLSIQWGIK